MEYNTAHKFKNVTKMWRTCHIGVGIYQYIIELIFQVKIQKMRSNLEEKLMKRMSIVDRKAEELRAAAQLQHTEQIKRGTGQARKTMNRQNSHRSCGCFPCVKQESG